MSGLKRVGGLRRFGRLFSWFYCLFGVVFDQRYFLRSKGTMRIRAEMCNRIWFQTT